MFVFINGTLAVDLGGVHCGIRGSVKVDEFSANVKTLQKGEVYTVSVFHAERQALASNFQLTFSMCVYKYCPGDEPEDMSGLPVILDGPVCEAQATANEQEKSSGPAKC